MAVRHSRRLLLGIVGMVTAVSAVAPAQQSPAIPSVAAQVPGMPVPGQTAPRMPARDRRPGDTERGTAIVRGVVVAADTGAPLRRAQVRVMPSNAPGGGGVTQTDGQGRFEVKELAAGRYSISASRSGYVTAQFGQRAFNQPGTPVELADGQVLDKVTFALARGGAIAGRIVDDLGEPVAGAQVMVQRFIFTGGSRRLVGAGAEGGNDRTDDLGQFRVFGLPPGEYYVLAMLRAMDFMPINARIQDGPDNGFAATFYPGVASVAEARRITVRPGQDVPNASFALVTAPLGRIVGRVTSSSGEPLSNAMIMISARDESGFGWPGIGGAQVRPDGTFQSSPLAPGSYSVFVQERNLPEGGEVARIDVQVNGDDVEDVLIVTGAGGVIRGRVVTDEGTLPPFRPSQVRISATPVEQSRMMGFGMRPPMVKDDWTFEVTGVLQPVRMNAFVDAQGSSGGLWVPRHAWKDNVDVMDTSIDIGPGQVVEDVEIVFTQKKTEASGVITDDRGQPVTDAWVVVFPEDRDRWTSGSRYVRPTRPDTNGKYTMRLTAYDGYRAVAVRSLEDGQWSDPEFLARALEHGMAFSIRDGESRLINLRLVEVK